MNNWNFIGKNAELFNELKGIDDSVANLLKEIVEHINTYDSGLIKFWIEEGLKPKVDSYFLRYVIPLYELMLKDSKNEIINALIIQLLSCISWRTFDNYIDSHNTSYTTQSNSLLTALHLYDFYKINIPEANLSFLESHYKLMTEQTIIEKTEPVDLNSIWKRCSIFLFAAEEIGHMSNENIKLYKQYINYSGLAHDTHDYFSDISGRIISLPVHWMKQLNPDDVLSINTVKALYHKVRQEVKPLEIYFKSMKVEYKFPLLNHLLRESWRTFHDE